MINDNQLPQLPSWLNITLKCAMPILSLYCLLKQYYIWSIIFLIFFIIDLTILIQNIFNKQSQIEIEKIEVSKVKSKWQ